MQSPSQPRTHRREKKQKRVLLYTTEKLSNPWTLTSLYYGMLI